MPPSIIQRVESKLRSLRFRRSEGCCRSIGKSSHGYREQTRSEIAAELLLQEQLEREQRQWERRDSKVESPRLSFAMNEEGYMETVGNLTPGDSISVEATEPFPDFDSSIGCEDYIDVFSHVSSRFWSGGRERSWSWSSNGTVAQLGESRQWEQDHWPMSLRPVASLDTGDVLYAEVPFLLFPGYYEEDPPIRRGHGQPFMQDGEYSDDVSSSVEKDEYTGDMLAFIDEMECAFGLLNDEKICNFDAINPDWRLIDEVEPRRFDDCRGTFEAMQRGNVAVSGCGYQKPDRVGFKSKMAGLGRFMMRLSGKMYRSV